MSLINARAKTTKFYFQNFLARLIINARAMLNTELSEFRDNLELV